MKRTLSWIALAFTLLPACGGSGPASTPPDGDPTVAGPASPSVPATSPDPAAPEDGGAASGVCSLSMQTVDDRTELDESCGARSRECTLEAGDSAWSCLCTAGTGRRSSCQAETESLGLVTLPADCCPAD